jgi:hypothetical protein
VVPGLPGQNLGILVCVCHSRAGGNIKWEDQGLFCPGKKRDTLFLKITREKGLEEWFIL